ncbi:MAG: hypothetical protein J7523_20360, partial [Cellulomonas sp.]|nr:hypothetical protein [Cellulomonas sp.]
MARLGLRKAADDKADPRRLAAVGAAVRARLAEDPRAEPRGGHGADLFTVPGFASPGECAALLALPWVLASERTRTAVVCTVATGAAVVASLARDWARDGADVMWSVVDEATGRRSYLPAGGYVAFGVVALGLAVAAGLVRRSGAAARAAREVAADEARRSAQLRTQADHLRTELTRQDERELIAREMHDTV